MKKMRILLTGGGSGGHIYPLIAVVEELKKIAADERMMLDIRYFGNPGHYEPELVGNGIRVVRTTESKIRRYFTLLHLIDFVKFIWSIPQTLWKVFWFMPDVAFSKGGPGAVAIINACAFYRIPIIIHDSDAIPGLTSRVTSRYARIIELAFPSAATYLEAMRNKIRIVGNPVRAALRFHNEELTVRAVHNAKQALNFAPELPLLLILGGSQGAATLNTFILENLALFLPRYQILHQVGVEKYDEYINRYNSDIKSMLSTTEALRYRPVPFFATDMRNAIIAADLVVSRAGAGSIFEIALAGKPSVIIPLPNAAYDHQRENAFQYHNAGACIVIEEENLIGNLVRAEIDELFAKPEQLKTMSARAKMFAKPDAAFAIAKDILSAAL